MYAVQTFRGGVRRRAANKRCSSALLAPAGTCAQTDAFHLTEVFAIATPNVQGNRRPAVWRPVDRRVRRRWWNRCSCFGGRDAGRIRTARHLEHWSCIHNWQCARTEPSTTQALRANSGAGNRGGGSMQLRVSGAKLGGEQRTSGLTNATHLAGNEDRTEAFHLAKFFALVMPNV